MLRKRGCIINVMTAINPATTSTVVRMKRRHRSRKANKSRKFTWWEVCSGMGVTWIVAETL